MSVFDVVRTVLAVRSYEDKPVPDDAIQRIVDAARLTGNAMNKQPWAFIIVKDRDTLSQLGSLIPNGPYVAEAACAIAVVIEQTEYAELDGSRAIQSMVLTAWDEGIGSNWVAVGKPEKVKPLLGIPDDRDILAIVPFGYPTKSIGRGAKSRKPVEETLFWERYGQKSE